MKEEVNSGGFPLSEAASCAIVTVAFCLQCRTLTVRNVLSSVSILGQTDLHLHVEPFWYLFVNVLGFFLICVIIIYLFFLTEL